MYVKLDSVESKQIGRIIIPDKVSTPTRVGTIQAVGRDCADLVPGDRVLVSYYSGVVIDMPELHQYNDEEGGGQDVHRIFTPMEILATVV
jgi:co-chaperonin GroES (HSP10)